MPKQKNSIAQQLLFVAEHVADHERPHEDVNDNDNHVRWTGKTDENITLSVKLVLASAEYGTGDSRKRFMVPQAALGLYEPDGSGIWLRVDRSRTGNARPLPAHDLVGKTVLEEFFYYPYYDEADLLFEGLKKIRENS